MSDDIEDIVAMARAAYRDERLADGPLYCKLADEIERLRASNESLTNLVEEMQHEARRSFLLPTAMMAFGVILLIVVSFM